jgi:cellulose synthase operon protein C
VLERKGDYDTAISEYELMLDKQPGNLVAANNLASLLLDRRADKASIKRAQSLAAILRKSQVPQFKDTLGWMSYHQGDYRTAVSLTEEAVTAMPDQAAVRYHLGMSYISTNQLEKASEQLKKALDLAPNEELAEEIRTALKKTGS